MNAPAQAHFKHAVQSICLSLQSLGVNLTPSLLKSAADGADVVRYCMRWTHLRGSVAIRVNVHRAMQSGPFGRSLHDLVILSLAGFPTSGDLLLRKYWDHISLENMTAGLPKEGEHSYSVKDLTNKCKF